MDRTTEKFNKGLQDYLDGKNIESEEDLNKVLTEYVYFYNSSLRNQQPLTENTARTSDDWVDLAEQTENRQKAYRYARKALALDPDNLDAVNISIQNDNGNLFDKYDEFRKACDDGYRLMKKKGYLPDEKGRFWQIADTRPFIRLLMMKMTCESNLGLLLEAEKTGEYIMELNENDNNGVRFQLMCIYADLLQKDKAEKLLQRSKERGYQESGLLLPAALLDFRMYEWDSAKEKLLQLYKDNRDTKKFFSAVTEGKFQSLVNHLDSMGYQPYTIDELTVMVQENEDTYKNAAHFFQWGNNILKKAYKTNKK